MKYIKFWNEMALTTYDGYIVKEDGNFFYLIYPVTYDWLEYLDKWEWLDEITLHPFEKTFFQPYEVGRPAKMDEDYLWLFDFPIEEMSVTLMSKVSNFFEHYMYASGKTFDQKLEYTIERTRFLFTKEEMKKIVAFFMEKENTNDTRLRILMSDTIKEYIE